MKFRAIGILVVAVGITAHLILLFFLADTQPNRQAGNDQITKFLFVSRSKDSPSPNQAAVVDLFDSQSLFMPTRFNSASSFTEISGLQEASEVFADFAPSLTLGVLPILSPNPTAALPDAEELLPISSSFVLSLLSRNIDTQILIPGDKATRASALLTRISSSGALATFDIPSSANFPKMEFDTRPIDVSLHLNEGRLIGNPTIWSDDIGLEEKSLIWAFLRNPESYLGLPDGYYKLSIYPQ